MYGKALNLENKDYYTVAQYWKKDKGAWENLSR
jgi:hypothetical protein